MSTPILPFAVWASGTNQNSIPANDNSLRNQILNGLVISDTTDAQPGSPADGDIYIITGAAAGTQWATFDEFDLAIFMDGAWYAFAPVDGVCVNLAGALVAWDGAAYAPVTGGGGMTNPMTTEGDIIYGGASGVPTRLAPGTATHVLTSNGPGVAPSYQAVGGGGGSGARGYAALRLKSPGGFQAVNDYGGNPTTVASVLNRVYFQPFSVERSIVVATVGAEVQTLGTGSVFRIGIYDNDESVASHAPGALLAQTADIASATTGYKSDTLSITLDPGVVYWAAIVAKGSGAPTFYCYPFASFPMQWFGRVTRTGNNPNNHIHDDIGAWTVMPANYGGTFALRSANVPAIFLAE